MLRMTAALAALALLAGLSLAADAADTQPTMTGDIRIHDPAVIEVGGVYAAFYTGAEGGIYRGAPLAKTSPDGLHWTNAGAVGKGVPKWVKDELGYLPRNIWAPTASRHGNTFYLYYSASSFGINTSAIGVMTSTTFDPKKPGEGWVDQGLVLKTNGRDDFNAIDPFRIDTSNGRAFLSFGSYWSGIKLRELDPVSGKLKAPDTQQFDLASRNGGAIEASSILEHEGKFYLFVSFDRCCAATQSTYRIMVGRADRIEGPYLDQAGTPMMNGGGSELLKTTGRFIGPGGQEAFHANGAEMLVFHYYDGAEGGTSKMQISPIRWSADGWPMLDALPE